MLLIWAMMQATQPEPDPSRLRSRISAMALGGALLSATFVFARHFIHG